MGRSEACDAASRSCQGGVASPANLVIAVLYNIPSHYTDITATACCSCLVGPRQNRGRVGRGGGWRASPFLALPESAAGPSAVVHAAPHTGTPAAPTRGRPRAAGDRAIRRLATSRTARPAAGAPQAVAQSLRRRSAGRVRPRACSVRSGARRGGDFRAPRPAPSRWPRSGCTGDPILPRRLISVQALATALSASPRPAPPPRPSPDPTTLSLAPHPVAPCISCLMPYT